MGLAFGPDGNLYVLESLPTNGLYRVLRFDRDGQPVGRPGDPDDFTLSSLPTPGLSIDFDADGVAYIMTASELATCTPGVGTCGASGCSCTPSRCQLDTFKTGFTRRVEGLTFDHAGNLVVGTADQSIYRLRLGGTAQIIGGSPGHPLWVALTIEDVDRDGVTDHSDNRPEIPNADQATASAAPTGFADAYGAVMSVRAKSSPLQRRGSPRTRASA
jgi:hypothetical protein